MSRPVPNMCTSHHPDSAEDSKHPLCEEDSHREHRAALDATIFAPASPRDEFVFELKNGQLRHGSRQA